LKDIYEKKPDIEGVAGAMQDYYRNGYYRKSLVYTPDCDCESDELDKIYVLYKTVEEADTQLNNSYNNLVNSMDNEELRKTLIDVEKQWISYKDAEFKTLESSFYLKNEKNPSEVAKKLSEKYKIKVIVDRISELDYLSEILEQGNYPKLDYNEITKEEESLKKLYAGVLNKMNNDGQTKKNLMDSQQKWTIFNESSKKFMQMFPGNTEANYMLVPVSQRKPEIVIYSLLPY
ncbi:MAG: lysozyme inhibitor LprI family protein, partial [Leptotrichiaceae bacterium]